MDPPAHEHGLTTQTPLPADAVAPITDRDDIQRLFLVIALGVIVYALGGMVAGGPQEPPIGHRGSTGFRVNVNQASAQELSLLPQVGPVLAERMVAEREARGPFVSVDDIARTPGVGPARVSLFAPLVVTDH
ncbi:MAG: ComEA family DNA-binding protein [Planctomycetaceae bacterium]